VGRATHEFKISTKYLFTLVNLRIVWNPQIQLSENIVIKPRNFRAHEVKWLQSKVNNDYYL